MTSPATIEMHVTNGALVERMVEGKTTTHTAFEAATAAHASIAEQIRHSLTDIRHTLARIEQQQLKRKLLPSVNLPLLPSSSTFAAPFLGNFPHTFRNSLDEVLRSLHRIEQQQSSSVHLPLLLNPPPLFPPPHPQSPSHSPSKTSHTPNRNDRQPLPSANLHVLPTPSQIQSSVDELHHSLVRIEQHRSKQPPRPFEMSPSHSPSPSITASSSPLHPPSTKISSFYSHPRSSAKSEAFKELEATVLHQASGIPSNTPTNEHIPQSFNEIFHSLSQVETQPQQSVNLPILSTTSAISTSLTTMPPPQTHIQPLIPHTLPDPKITKPPFSTTLPNSLIPHSPLPDLLMKSLNSAIMASHRAHELYSNCDTLHRTFHLPFPFSSPLCLFVPSLTLCSSPPRAFITSADLHHLGRTVAGDHGLTVTPSKDRRPTVARTCSLHGPLQNLVPYTDADSSDNEVPTDPFSEMVPQHISGHFVSRNLLEASPTMSPSASEKSTGDVELVEKAFPSTTSSVHPIPSQFTT